MKCPRYEPQPEQAPPHRYVQKERCPRCDEPRVIGEPGWRCCMECGWDELPAKSGSATDRL